LVGEKAIAGVRGVDAARARFGWGTATPWCFDSWAAAAVPNAANTRIARPDAAFQIRVFLFIVPSRSPRHIVAAEYDRFFSLFRAGLDLR
jgi:hypothetical protein